MSNNNEKRCLRGNIQVIVKHDYINGNKDYEKEVKERIMKLILTENEK